MGGSFTTASGNNLFKYSVYHNITMTSSKLDDLRNLLASAMLIDITEEVPDFQRANKIMATIYEALDYVKNTQDDILQAIKEADESLIAHVNRRV